MFSLILILYKLDNSYVCPLGKSGMSRHYLSTMCVTLGQLAAEILVFLYVYPLFFCNFYHNSHVFINIHEYVNKISCTSNHSVLGLCLSNNLAPSLLL